MPAVKNQCAAICKNGKPCPNNAKDGVDLCGIHIRSRRHAVSKAIQRGADRVRGVAGVAMAAVAVVKAAQMISEHWPTIEQVLSHVINFCFQTPDSGREMTTELAGRLEKAAAAFEKVKTWDEFRNAAYGFEGAADYFLLPANAIRDNIGILSAAHNKRSATLATESFLTETSTDAAIRFFQNFLLAHRKFADEMRAVDPALHSELSGFFPSYSASASL